MIDPTEDLLHRGLPPRLDDRANGKTAGWLAGWLAAGRGRGARCSRDGRVARLRARRLRALLPGRTATYGAPGWSRQDGDHKIALVASQVAALWSSRPRATGPQSLSNPCPICWAVPITATPTPLGLARRLLGFIRDKSVALWYVDHGDGAGPDGGPARGDQAGSG
jgi:hypothetical protein